MARESERRRVCEEWSEKEACKECGKLEFNKVELKSFWRLSHIIQKTSDKGQIQNYSYYRISGDKIKHYLPGYTLMLWVRKFGKSNNLKYCLIVQGDPKAICINCMMMLVAFDIDWMVDNEEVVRHIFWMQRGFIMPENGNKRACGQSRVGERDRMMRLMNFKIDYSPIVFI